MTTIRLTFAPGVASYRDSWTNLYVHYNWFTDTGEAGSPILVGRLIDGMVFDIPTPPPSTFQLFAITETSYGSVGRGLIQTKFPVTLSGNSYSCYANEIGRSDLLYCTFTVATLAPAPTPVVPCPNLSIDLPTAISAPAGNVVAYPVHIRESAGVPADIRLITQNSVVWQGHIEASSHIRAPVELEMPYNSLQQPLDLQANGLCYGNQWTNVASAIMGFNPCFPALAIKSFNLPGGVLPDADLSVVASVINQGCEGAVRLLLNLGGRDVDGSATRIPSGGTLERRASLQVPWTETVPVAMTGEYLGVGRQWIRGASARQDIPVLYPKLTLALDGPSQAAAGSSPAYTARVSNQGAPGQAKVRATIAGQVLESDAFSLGNGEAVSMQFPAEVPYEETFAVAATPLYLGPGRNWTQAEGKRQDVKVLYPEMHVTGLAGPAAASPGNSIEAVAEARNTGASGAAGLRVSNSGEARLPPVPVAAGQALRVRYLGEMPADEQTTLQATASWVGVRRSEQFSSTVTQLIRAKDAVFEYDDHITVYGGDNPLTVRGTLTGQAVKLEGSATGLPPSPVGGPYNLTIRPGDTLTIRFQRLLFLFMETDREVSTVKNRRLVARRSRNYLAGTLSTGPNMALSALTQVTARRPSVRRV